MCKTYSLIPNCILGSNISEKLMKTLWIELYAMANFGETETLHRGQLKTTYAELCERAGLSLKQVRMRIDRLVTEKQLVREATNKGLILTIVDYDKHIIGKGRRNVATRPRNSVRCANDSSQKGNQRADITAGSTTNARRCVSEDSDNKASDQGISNGRQNASPDIIIRETKENVVVREDNNNSGSSFSTADHEVVRQKQQQFKEDVLSYLNCAGQRQNLENPVFKLSVTEYLRRYGAWKCGQTLLYETVKGFTIEYSLNLWLRNDKKLNPQTS